jgi:signal transduction histidine kinase
LAVRHEAALYLVISVLAVVVFGIDLAVPLGTAVWILYLIPVVLAYVAPRPLLPVLTAAVVILAIALGFMVDRPGIDPRVAATNRAMGAIVVAILGVAGFLFVRGRTLLQRSDWLQEGQVIVAKAAQGDGGVEAIAGQILAALARRLQARAAVFYAREEDGYRRVASFGVPEGAQVPPRFGPGEGGHLWRCATEGRILSLDALPDEALVYGSGLARGRAAQSVLAPVSEDGRVNGVLEFGLDRPMTPEGLSLLDRVANEVGIAVRSAQYRRQLRDLLEETRRQADELRAHTEELATANEELEEQTRALQDSQQRLERQQSELEELNVRLEAQAQEMEAQRDALEQSRRRLGEQACALETESRYKSEFVANMSHELRTPLNALLIMARLLADNRSGNLTGEQVNWAHTIEGSGQDLLVLINDILDLSKIEAGKLDLEILPARPAEMVQKLVQGFAAQAEAKGLRLRSDVPNDLPQFETDPARVGQVLRNFLSNALKFTERGEVVVGCGPTGNAWRSTSATPASASPRPSRRRSSRHSARPTAP